MSYKSKIVSTGKYLPEGVITNFDLEKLVDTNDEWIVSRTGINTRRKALESVLDMAYNASMDAIKKAEYDKDKIDLIKEDANKQINDIMNEMDELKKREYVNIDNFMRLNKTYLLYLAMIVTVISGIDYFKKNWHVMRDSK